MRDESIGQLCRIISFTCFLSTVVFLSSCNVLAEEIDLPAYIHVGHFSSGAGENGLPVDWEELHFKGVKPTRYTLIRDHDQWIVKAVSHTSASGLIRTVEIDPKSYPILTWSWKVENLLEKSNLTEKSGDDHPARIYIGFEYDRSSFNWMERLFYWMVRIFYGKDYPSRAINYIWASKEPIGTVRSNPYTDWVRTIVVESGDKHLNQWVEVERNVYEDYKQAFGKEEPPRITGIGIMTDSDSTDGRAVAYYGDILFKSA